MQGPTKYKINVLHFAIEKQHLDGFDRSWSNNRFPDHALTNFRAVHLPGFVLYDYCTETWREYLRKLHEAATAYPKTGFHVIPMMMVNETWVHESGHASDFVIRFANEIEITHLGVKASSSASTIEVHPARVLYETG
jgi:hypothetical protein